MARTREELYVELCKEAGTYDGHSDPDAWWTECAHNITDDLAKDLERAGLGDVYAVARCRQAVGLPVFSYGTPGPTKPRSAPRGGSRPL